MLGQLCNKNITKLNAVCAQTNVMVMSLLTVVTDDFQMKLYNLFFIFPVYLLQELHKYV